jgi:hypothetical protein
VREKRLMILGRFSTVNNAMQRCNTVHGENLPTQMLLATSCRSQRSQRSQVLRNTMEYLPGLWLELEGLGCIGITPFLDSEAWSCWKTWCSKEETKHDSTIRRDCCVEWPIFVPEESSYIKLFRSCCGLDLEGNSMRWAF